MPLVVVVVNLSIMFNSIPILFAIAFVTTVGGGEPVSEEVKPGEYNQYYLYNRDVYGEEISFDGESNGLIESIPTAIIVHGHRGSHITSLTPHLQRELLQSEDLNVITVDWSKFASLPYTAAQNAVLSVGDYLATFITNQRINLASIHLIGLDLGAHIAGVAGRRHFGRIARITGLSPTTNLIKVSSTDAAYVEVIHTATACQHGLAEKLGHADFYPNGGANQTGCWDCDCHHNRSWMYFFASIKDNTFNANCCDNMLEKDEDICRGTFLPLGNNRLRKTPCAAGIYRVNTRDVYPF